MTRLMSDLVPALIAACDGELKDFDLRWFDEAALTVVMAAERLPRRSYDKGYGHRRPRQGRQDCRCSDLPRRHSHERRTATSVAAQAAGC
jgi:phosphoribosylamine-glycine ligase